MSALSIQVPFPVFQGRDGQPLENGYVWIGEPNLNPQTNPVVAYYDEALTIVAAQPLRTLNGYISRAGTPAQIYVNGVDFSILVQDSKGSMVYNFPEGTGISADACGVTYDPPFTGGVPYPVCEKLEQTVSVKDFGAVGNGVSDDTAPINLALVAGAGGIVWMPEGNYYISGTLVVPPATTLKGVGACDILVPLAGGSNISITHTGSVGVTLGRGATLDGVNFWYPNQVTTSPPTVYNYAIQINTTDVSFQNGNNGGVNIHNIVIHNAYKGIDLGGDPSDYSPVYGVVNMDNIRMYAMHTGIHSGATLSEVFLSNSVFSPVMWTASTGSAARQWAMTDGVACLHFEGLQGIQMSSNVFFGHARGIYGQSSTTSLANGNITFNTVANCTFDGVKIGVEMTGNMGLAGGTFSGCTFASIDPFNVGVTTAKCIYLNDSQNANSINFTGCEFLGTHGSHFYIDSPTSTSVNSINITGCQFLNCNSNGQAGNFYNIYCDDATTNINITGVYILNIVSGGTITNIKIPNAAQLTLCGINVHDTTNKAFDIGTVAASAIVSGITTRSTVASTWPTVIQSFVIVAAATITLYESDLRFYPISGNTNINTITPSWPGRVVTLKFEGTPTISDGTGNLKLSSNFVATADDTLTLGCDGTSWFEIARSVN